MFIRIALVIVFAVVPLVGCKWNGGVKNEQFQQVSLIKAMEELGEGIRRMRAAQACTQISAAMPCVDGKTGNIVASMSVTLKLTATGNNSQSLGVDLSASPSVVGDAGKIGVTGNVSESLAMVRDNTITINFLHPLLAPEKTLLYNKSPADVKLLLETLEGSRMISISSLENMFEQAAQKDKDPRG